MFRLRRLFQFAIGAIAIIFACGIIFVLTNGGDDAATPTPATRSESLAPPPLASGQASSGTSSSAGTVRLVAKSWNNGKVHVWGDLRGDANSTFRDVPESTACTRLDNEIHQIQDGGPPIYYYNLNCGGVTGYVEVEQARINNPPPDFVVATVTPLPTIPGAVALAAHTPNAEEAAPPTPTLATEVVNATPLPPHTPVPTATGVAARPGQGVQVINIVDGDTIDVLLDGTEYRVRYILVDTPERGMPYFNEATAANAALVAGQTIYLVKDVSETDRYGRLLRYIYLADGTFVNEVLVRQGFAQIATFPPDVAMEAQIRAAQAEAIAAGRGLWAAAAPVAEAPTATPPPAAPVTAANGLRPVADQNGNLRGGPGTEYEIVGSIAAGQPLQVVYKNPAGDWYQLGSGEWIAAFLVSGAAPADVPVAPSLPEAPAPVVVEQPAAVEQTRGGETIAVGGGQCDPSYPDVCIPPISVSGDLDCGEIPQFARFRVLPPDPHGFDGRDQDGLGCESN